MYMVFFLLYILCALTCLGVLIASAWVAFSKARRPGWASIVPVYNLIVFLDIAGKPWWWVFILIAPHIILLIGFILTMILLSFTVALIFYGLAGIASIASLVFMIIAAISFAHNYGKGTGFAIGCALLAPVFWPLLAFGDAEYQGA
jgi:Family of unknown function (DUF5684)